jgi:hypothetical protein
MRSKSGQVRMFFSRPMSRTVKLMASSRLVSELDFSYGFSLIGSGGTTESGDRDEITPAGVKLQVPVTVRCA